MEWLACNLLGVVIILGIKYVCDSLLKKNFDTVETLIVAQGVGILSYDAIMTTLRYMNVYLEPRESQVLKSIPFLFFLALFFGMICIGFLAFGLIHLWTYYESIQPMQPKLVSRLHKSRWIHTFWFLLSCFIMIQFVLSPWMFIPCQMNPFIWYILIKKVLKLIVKDI